MPWVRHRSATFRPASPSLTIARICSSVNLLRFMGPPRNGGPHSRRGGLPGAGHQVNYFAPVVVVATAGVQYVNGGANWGYDYYEDGVDLAQFYGPWLLSVNAVGGGEHNCQWFCEPEGWMVSSCEAMSDPEFTYYWDYNVCSCVSNSSPIIIDMKRD